MTQPDPALAILTDIRARVDAGNGLVDAIIFVCDDEDAADEVTDIIWEALPWAVRLCYAAGRRWRREPAPDPEDRRALLADWARAVGRDRKLRLLDRAIRRSAGR